MVKHIKPLLPSVGILVVAAGPAQPSVWVLVSSCPELPFHQGELVALEIAGGVLTWCKLGTSALCSALVRPHLVCWVQLWGLQYKRKLDMLERDQWRAIKMVKGLEHSAVKRS